MTGHLLEDFKLKLHLFEDIQPAAQPARKLPFKIRQQVENKIAGLEKLDIIEKIEGLTLWVSPLIAIRKLSGEIRLYVFTRKANRTVQQGKISYSKHTAGNEWCENIFKTSSKTFVSSDRITTVASHKGLYRYKRLI